MMVTDLPVLSFKAFPSCFLSSPVEEREGEYGWVGIWQPAEVNPPHFCYTEKLIKSNKNEDLDPFSNTENPQSCRWLDDE